jgi:SP family sugar:H+ symporter-like MFS transporter
MSLSVASNWLWNFGIGYATPYLVNKSTPEVKTAGLGVKVFLIWVRRRSRQVFPLRIEG